MRIIDALHIESIIHTKMLVDSTFQFCITPAWHQRRRRQIPSHFDQWLEHLLCSDPIGEYDM